MANTASNSKKDFPIFKARPRGRPLVYLDSAATSQKPGVVIDAMKRFMEKENANVHRGIYALSEEATARYEGARRAAARFINAPDPKEIIFTKGTTEALNLVAYSFGRTTIARGDEILLSVMEHHANLVPWQILAKEKGAKLVFTGITKDHKLDTADFKKKLSPRTKIVALSHVSNVLGTINPIRDIVKIVRNVKFKFPISNFQFPITVIDAAQSVPHMKIDVQKLGCDFLAFSGHKMYGPTGIGVLWGRLPLLEAMPPYQTGGTMIREVTLEDARWNDVPIKFEAGTPPITEAIGLARAIEYLERVGMGHIHAREEKLTRYALKKMRGIPGVTIYGPRDATARGGGMIAFNLKGVHPHDLASILDQGGICIRAGHHCAMPLHAYLGLDATCRISFGIYTTKEDVDIFIHALKSAKKLFSSK